MSNGDSQQQNNTRKENVEEIKKVFQNMLKSVHLIHPKTENKNIIDQFNEKKKSLFDYIQSLCLALNFSKETLFLSYYYIIIILKRIASKNDFIEIDFHQIALGCFLLAVKFNENDPDVPSLNKIQGLDYRHYFRIEEMKQSELFVLVYLEYKLNHYSIYDYLKIFLEFHEFHKDDNINQNYNSISPRNINENISIKTPQLAFNYKTSFRKSDSTSSNSPILNKNEYYFREFLQDELRDLYNNTEFKNITKYNNYSFALAIMQKAREKFNYSLLHESTLAELLDIKVQDYEECYNFLYNK